MITFIVCLLAGLGAGLGTGFAGMSAAAVISPMLIAFLHMDLKINDNVKDRTCLVKLTINGLFFIIK